MPGGVAMVSVVLGLGSNLGNRLEALQSAVLAIRRLPNLTLESVSSVYETTPWGPVSQPDFLNAVAITEAEEVLTPDLLLDAVEQIERHWGKQQRTRWGACSIDIDIVDFGRRLYQSPRLTLPHPYTEERAFVLVPWLELDPRAELPGHGSVMELSANLDTSTVMLREDLSLTPKATS
jgi:2-amino-4-hydroxy-6-hydroxymethyldihydropteridine diphosphokinase